MTRDAIFRQVICTMQTRLMEKISQIRRLIWVILLIVRTCANDGALAGWLAVLTLWTGPYTVRQTVDRWADMLYVRVLSPFMTLERVQQFIAATNAYGICNNISQPGSRDGRI